MLISENWLNPEIKLAFQFKVIFIQIPDMMIEFILRLNYLMISNMKIILKELNNNTLFKEANNAKNCSKAERI